MYIYRSRQCRLTGFGRFESILGLAGGDLRSRMERVFGASRLARFLVGSVRACFGCVRFRKVRPDVAFTALFRSFTE